MTQYIPINRDAYKLANKLASLRKQNAFLVNNINESYEALQAMTEGDCVVSGRVSYFDREGKLDIQKNKDGFIKEYSIHLDDLFCALQFVMSDAFDEAIKQFDEECLREPLGVESPKYRYIKRIKNIKEKFISTIK